MLHAVAPAISVYDPWPHAVHVDAVVAPNVAENVPGWQAKHKDNASAPLFSLYVPLGQSSHVLPDDAASTVEYLPALHSRQSVEL
jgi:hypothetical protein